MKYLMISNMEVAGAEAHKKEHIATFGGKSIKTARAPPLVY